MQLLLQEGQARGSLCSAEVTEACRFQRSRRVREPRCRRLSLLRTESCARRAIPCSCRSASRAETGIRNADMVVAFGNLLDNAAEACRDAEKRLLSRPHGRALPVHRGPQPGPWPRPPLAQPPHPGAGARHRLAHLRALAETYEGATRSRRPAANARPAFF